MNRRPLKTRDAAWARRSASMLARAGVSPNAISVASVAFAMAGAAALLALPEPGSLLLCAACIQLRLLCNMLDGMVAVEEGRQSPEGALYNEIPDRLADALFLVAAGYLAQLPWLGWCAAWLSAVTAYIRVLGGSLGLPQDFRGPMAKPHRMALLTGACVLAAAEHAWRGTDYVLPAALWLIAAGSALTCATRTRAIAAALRARGTA